MKKLLFAVVGVVLFSLVAKAQRPDLPGALIIDIGLNSWGEAPTNLDLNSFQSKTVNILYYYDIPIGKSGFTFTPGFGLGLEKYSFDNPFTLSTTTNNTGDRTIGVENLATLIPDASSIGKTKFGANYFDVPLEFRYYLSKNQYNRGFRVAMGAKVGVLYSSFIKYRYEDFAGDNRLIKDRSDYGLNRFRYGAQFRIGFGGFSFFGYYELSDKWETPPPGGIDTRTTTIGISLTGF